MDNVRKGAKKVPRFISIGIAPLKSLTLTLKTLTLAPSA